MEVACEGVMELEMENMIAVILMREAAELRRQAEKDGVHAYLQQPKARFRPNSQFFSATVRGVEQGSSKRTLQLGIPQDAKDTKFSLIYKETLFFKGDYLAKECRSVARHRLLYFFFLYFFSFESGVSVLWGRGTSLLTVILKWSQ